MRDALICVRVPCNTCSCIKTVTAVNVTVKLYGLYWCESWNSHKHKHIKLKHKSDANSVIVIGITMFEWNGKNGRLKFKISALCVEKV